MCVCVFSVSMVSSVFFFFFSSRCSLYSHFLPALGRSFSFFSGSHTFSSLSHICALHIRYTHKTGYKLCSSHNIKPVSSLLRRIRQSKRGAFASQFMHTQIQYIKYPQKNRKNRSFRWSFHLFNIFNGKSIQMTFQWTRNIHRKFVTISRYQVYYDVSIVATDFVISMILITNIEMIGVWRKFTNQIACSRGNQHFFSHGNEAK